MSKRYSLITAFLVFFLAAAACAPKSTGPSIKIIVDIEKTEEHAEYPGEYWPEHVVIKKGTTVTWTNSDSKEHTVTSGSLFNQKLAPRASFSHTFTEAGNYTYRCELFHEMAGQVVVE